MSIRDEAIKRADAVPGSTHAVENIAAGVDAALRVIRAEVVTMRPETGPDDEGWHDVVNQAHAAFADALLRRLGGV